MTCLLPFERVAPENITVDARRRASLGVLAELRELEGVLGLFMNALVIYGNL